MFVKWPYIYGLSETKLRCKIEFFLKDMKIEKAMLVQHPNLVSFSLKESEDLRLITTLSPPNRRFCERYILPFAIRK